MIVSSLPTHELRMIDPEIFIEGSMRFTQSEKLADFLNTDLEVTLRG